MNILMITNSRTEVAEACAHRLTEALSGTVEWLPDEQRYIAAALARLTADPGCRTVLLCGGDAVGPSAHLRAAVDAALTGHLPGFGQLLRARLEPALGVRTMLITAPAGHIGHTAVFTVPLSEAAVSAAVDILSPSLDLLHRHLRGDTIAEISAPAAQPEAPEAAPQEEPAPATLDAEFEDIPEGISITAMPSEEAPPEHEELPSGWRAGLRAIGGRLDREVWVHVPEELSDIAAVRDLLERAGQRASVALPDGRRMAAFGFPDLTRSHSKVLLLGAGAPVAEVIALHRYPHQAGLTIWGDRGLLLPSGYSDIGLISEQRFGLPPPADGELFAVDHDAMYIARGADILRWDGNRLEKEGSEQQAIASLMLRWSQR